MADEKTKTAARRTSDPKLKSDALKNFEENLEQISAFLAQLASFDLTRGTRALQRIVTEEAASAPKTNAKRIQRGIDAYSAKVKKFLAYLYPACRWMSVMLVSFLETYLEDVLVSIAEKNPRVVKNTKIEPIRLFEVDSLEEVRAEVRSNWANDTLRPDGPATWYRRLRDLGAPPFDQSTLMRIQLLWDTRNLIVHSRCIATIAYVKKYPHLGIKQGAKVVINLHTFGTWIPPVKEFVEWADNFFLKYGQRGKAGSTNS